MTTQTKDQQQGSRRGQTLGEASKLLALMERESMAEKRDVARAILESTDPTMRQYARELLGC